MKKDPKTLTTIRIEQETLDRIDAFIICHPMWTRNFVIGQVLKRLFEYVDDDKIYDLVRGGTIDSVIVCVERQNLMKEKQP